MAKRCNASAGEDEWIRDTFINNMKNSDIQRKLLTETLLLLEALNKALIDEKGRTNHMEMTSTFKSNGYFPTNLLIISILKENSLLISKGATLA